MNLYTQARYVVEHAKFWTIGERGEKINRYFIEFDLKKGVKKSWFRPINNNLPVGTYTVTMTDSNDNSYTFDDSAKFTVSRISKVYISPSGTGTGAISTSLLHGIK